MFGRKKKANSAQYNLPHVPGPDLAKINLAMEKVQIEDRIKAFYARSGGPGPAAPTIARVTQEHLLHAKDHGEPGRVQTYGDVMSKLFDEDRSLSAVSGAARNTMASTMSFMSQFAPRRDPGIEHVAREIKGLAESIRESRVGTTAPTSEKALPVPTASEDVTERITRLEEKIDRLTTLMERQSPGQGDGLIVVPSIGENSAPAAMPVSIQSPNGATLAAAAVGMDRDSTAQQA